MSSTTRDRWLVAFLVSATFVAFFGRTLGRNEVFAFRDAAYFYYPSFHLVQDKWREGFPLWNDLEQTGRPLLADPTSCAFYPGTLLFALPIEYSRAYTWFVAGHIALAALNGFLAARAFGRSVLASGLCSICYSFGGAIVFQYCNVIYLIAAAWLPIGLSLSRTVVAGPAWRNVLELAAVESMMILGGDPQCAYHLVLIQILFVLFRVKGTLSRGRLMRSVGTACVPVGILALAVALSAVQFLPAFEWSGASDRSVPPRFTAGSWERVFSPPEPGSHQAESYEFSIGPWRWAELICPNAFGRMFPANHRWSRLIPAEGRTWTPTLYCGFVPVLLVALRLRRPFDPADRWLVWTMCGTAIASLGEYGVGWILNELLHGMGFDYRLWNPIGGLYWLMNLVLPCYQQFRYPAKLWTCTALAIGLLAASGFDGRLSVISRRNRLVWFAWASVGAGMFVWFSPWEPAIVECGDRLFGPLVIDGATADLSRSLFHVGIVAMVVGLVLTCVPSEAGIRSMLLAITAVDLIIANGWCIQSADPAHWRASSLADTIRSHAANHRVADYRVWRFQGRSWYPAAWSENASERRIQEGLDWDRTTLAPRYGLLDSLPVFSSSGSFSAADFQAVVAIKDAAELPPSTVLDAFGIAYVIAPTRMIEQRDDLEMIHSRDLFGEAVSIGFKRNALPRSWIVYRYTASRDSRDQSSIGDLFPTDVVSADLRSSAILAAKDDIPVWATEGAGDLVSSRSDEVEAPIERCCVMRFRATEISVRARLGRPGLVVMSDYFSPGWKCAARNLVTGDQFDVPVVRVNHIMRGVFLPAGDYELTYRYQPLVFTVGLSLSAVAWIVSFVAWTFNGTHAKASGGNKTTRSSH